MKIAKMIGALSLTILLSVSGLEAATKGSVSMPDRLKIGKKTLQLNGLGIRQATIFNVDVYVGGLYLSKKTKKAVEVLDGKGPKFLRMKFVRDVEKKKLVEGWNKGFDRSVAKATRVKIKNQIKKFNSAMEDVSEGDEIKVAFLGSTVKLKVKGKKMVVIKGKEFSKSLLSLWFVNPTDEGLRDGLLGL